jgi:hypothetical protein
MSYSAYVQQQAASAAAGELCFQSRCVGRHARRTAPCECGVTASQPSSPCPYTTHHSNTHNTRRRSPVYGTRGMVACSQPLAAEAGLRILQSGGNAADAAVAVAAALGVTEPCSTGGPCVGVCVLRLASSCRAVLSSVPWQRTPRAHELRGGTFIGRCRDTPAYTHTHTRARARTHTHTPARCACLQALGATRLASSTAPPRGACPACKVRRRPPARGPCAACVARSRLPPRLHCPARRMKQRHAHASATRALKPPPPGNGAAPAGLTLAAVRARGVSGPEMPHTHALCVTVPGAVALWEAAVAAWGGGRATLADVLAPAIELAERGFPVAPVAAAEWSKGAALIAQQGGPGARALTDARGRGPGAGQLWRNRDLAATYRRIAQHGAAEGARVCLGGAGGGGGGGHACVRPRGATACPPCPVLRAPCLPGHPIPTPRRCRQAFTRALSRRRSWPHCSRAAA